MAPKTDDRDDGTGEDPLREYIFDNANPKSYTGQESSNPNSDATNRQKGIPIPFLDRLRTLPELRSIPWRPGQELPPEKSTESPRVQQRGACLLATRGKVMERPCNHCIAGLGRFSACIALEYWFQGACSTCIFTSKGNKCSLRIQTLGTTDGRALRYASSKAEMDGQHIFYEPEHMQTLRKRKKMTAPSQSGIDNAYTSPYPPVRYVPSGSEKTTVSPRPYPDEDTLLQAEIARNERSGQERHVHDMDEDKTRQHKLDAPLGESEDDHQVLAQKAYDLSRQLRSEQFLRSLYPAAKDYNEYQPEDSVLRPEVPSSTEEAAAPLIDRLPRPKQRQIYGLISGLQSGIDHLQKELNSLQSAMDIDFEEPRQSG